MVIVPAIYPEVFEEIVDKLYVLSGVSKLAQIVICDGSYGLRVSWSPLGKEILPDSFNYEFDLILTDWKTYLPRAYQLGVKRVVIHIDEFTEEDYEELFRAIHYYEIVLGITVSNDISIDVLVNALKKIESSEYFDGISKVFVQVSGVKNLSEKEHPFDERAVARIRILKKMFPALTVQVSGRISPETAWLVKDAGADRMVVGSYIFGHEDLQEALRTLKEAMEQERLAIKPEVKKVVKEPIKPEVKKPKETKEERLKREAYEASKEEIVYGTDDDFFTK